MKEILRGLPGIEISQNKLGTEENFVECLRMNLQMLDTSTEIFIRLHSNIIQEHVYSVHIRDGPLRFEY